MRNKFPQSTLLPKSPMHIKNIWSLLTEPAESIQEPERRRRMRLLSILLVALIPLMLLGTITILRTDESMRQISQIMLYIFFIFIVAYVLNRKNLEKLAITIVLGVLSLLPYITWAIKSDYSHEAFFASFIRILLTILLGSLLLSNRGVVVLTIINLGGLFSLPLFFPALEAQNVVDFLIILFPMVVIIIVGSTIRQKDLKKIELQTHEIVEHSNVLAMSEQALRESRDKLELRVQERTIELEDTNIKLQTSVGELKQHTSDTVLLAEMGDLLQACTSTEEASRAIGHTIPQLFPDTSGGLFVYNASSDKLETVFTWGLPSTKQNQLGIEPDKCWALRRGRPHRMKNLCTAFPCQDLPKPEQILCIPMVAHGDTLGVLHLRVDEPSGASPKSAMLLKEQLALTSAEHMALSLSNLNLRETLRHQSIRDPLTGLFNRRYMDETLERERLRAARANTSLGVIMLDIDHFRKFNDMFGHEAGDKVLEELGILLKNYIRGSDIACRYGGEEFILILPESPMEIVIKRAELIRSEVKNMSVQHLGQSMGSITLSLGLAIFPQHATTSDALLRAADRALYRAKKAGRDQVIIANDS